MYHFIKSLQYATDIVESCSTNWGFRFSVEKFQKVLLLLLYTKEHSRGSNLNDLVKV